MSKNQLSTEINGETQKFTPSLEMKSMPSRFMVSATLTKKVDPHLLQKAVDTITPRFSFIQVKEKRWLLSSSLIFDGHTPQVTPLSRQDRTVLYPKSTEPLSIIYTEDSIGITASHTLTDGHGVLDILKSLILTYHRLAGMKIPESNLILEPGSSSKQQETEDTFKTYYRQEIPSSKISGNAFHTTGRAIENHTIRYITGTIRIEDLKAKTETYKITITEYLAAVYLYALYRIQRKSSAKRTPIRLSIPVDLRKLYDSKTLRNFSLFIRPEIHTGLGSYDFSEIVHHVYHSMRFDLQKKNISSAIRSSLINHLYTWKLLHQRGEKNRGERLHSGTLSNLGKISLPEELSKSVSHFDFLLGPNRINPENCGLVGYDKEIHVNFTRTVEDPVVSREFFRLLVEQGIPVEIH